MRQGFRRSTLGQAIMIALHFVNVLWTWSGNTSEKCINTGIKLDFGDSRRHLLSLLLKTKRSDVLTLKNLRGKALIDLGPFLEREFVDLDFARLATTTGGIC
mmetsp:Transcript_35747/g.74819  ORF Transcript_35747/g.74819 Transcript_35747/m.74819 type:complete len:102 (+) Transcript_35747:411-716(+)